MWITPAMNNTTKLTAELGEIVKSGVNIWDFDYPSYYSGEEKTAFEQKVIDHYYFRQIGQETVGRWLHYFRARIREIMPYYIQMYKSVEIMDAVDDPFGNVDMTETFEQTTTGNTTDSTDTTTNTEGSSNENTTRKFSDTPQGSIDNVETYMSEGELNDGVSNSSSTATVTGTGNSTESGTMNYTLTRKGNQGVSTYAHDMIEYRNSFINVDMMIINELNDLFLGVY